MRDNPVASGSFGSKAAISGRSANGQEQTFCAYGQLRGSCTRMLVGGDPGVAAEQDEFPSCRWLTQVTSTVLCKRRMISETLLH